MATPANTVTRYDEVGVREQLANAITRTDPETTPVTSGMGSMSFTQTHAEYMRDTLRAPNPNNAAIDGDDAVTLAQVQPERLMAHPQIFTGTIGTSGRANAVNTAGRATEHAYQVAREYKGLQRDMEARAVGLFPAVVGNNGAAMETASLATHFFTNADTGAGGAFAPHNAGAATVAPVAGAARAFQQAQLEAAMQSCYDASGETPKMVTMSSSHKVTFASFTGLAQIRDTRSRGRGEQTQAVYGADLYVSNFGTLAVVPHWIMQGFGHVLGLNQKYNKMGYLRRYQKARLAKTGDSKRDQLLVDGGFCVKAEKTQFVIADLNA